jgi:DNA excision repair protein ERCC-1
LKSFAQIARASSDQLQTLPGFGQIKVRRLKDAFEKPFRQNVTNAVSTWSQQPGSRLDNAPSQVQQTTSSITAAPLATLTTQGEPRQPVAGLATSGAATSTVRRRASPSPDWDMEFDSLPNEDVPYNPQSPQPPQPPYNSSPDASARPMPTAPSSTIAGNKRPPSPIWDLELDLNPSDEDGPPPSKQAKTPVNDTNSSAFGSDTLLSCGPDQ